MAIGEAKQESIKIPKLPLIGEEVLSDCSLGITASGDRILLLCY